MTISISLVLPLIIALIGLVIYWISTPKASEIGRLLFFIGVFVWLFQFGGYLR